MQLDQGRPRTLKVVIAVNAIMTTVVIVVGLWIGSRNPLGFGIVALSIVFFAVAVMRARRMFGPGARPGLASSTTSSGVSRR